ncbi:MAG: DNA polymerase I [Eubacteriales bacterium]|nr:DNA polymerase I [Eubacteriales bacterium]
MKKLLIIDGNSILNRAYYGIRPLTAPDGTPTNAVYGFLNILLKHLDEESYDYLCVAFDVKEKTFRHKRYELYKAQRKPAPEDFLVQLPLMKEVLAAMNCMCMELPGYEADDIIGTVSKICDQSDVECNILTGDKDDLQLISDNTTVKLVVTRMGRTTTTDYRPEQFREKYGIEPSEFIDVKALMGDASDNIPGVAGVGEKTAMSLIQNYKNIDYIYEHIDELEIKEGVRNKLKNDRDNAYLSYELATIDRNAPIDFDFSAAVRGDYNESELAALFTRLNFRSFISKLKLDKAAEAAEATDTIEGIGKSADFKDLISAARAAKKVAYTLSGNRLFIKPPKGDVIYADADKEDLKEFFGDSEISKVGYDIKEDIIAVSEYGIDAPESPFRAMTFDVMLAAYILDPTQSSYPIDTLCTKYLSAYLDCDDSADGGEQLSMLDVIEPSSDKTQLIINRVYAIERLAEKMADEIEKNGQHYLYYDVELPLTEVLARLQLRGMYVDRDELTDFGRMLDDRINLLCDEIYSLAGEEFNINSPKQLGVILFEKLELPFGKKNKSGGYSTNAEILEKLRDKHEIVEKVLEYRQLAKLKSTYVTGLSSVVNPKTGRIHSHFNQTVTNTGRLSSTEPNLQNIPVRTPLGREIRKMFIAEKDGWTLIDADYSQIELRVLAHIADDTAMKQAFLDNEDIHTQTAATVFKTPVDEVTPLMRSRAKAVNFGIVYGIGAFSLAKDIGTSRAEAQQYIDEYLAHYGNVALYMNQVIESAKECGYITTVLGRRRYIPELSASSHQLRMFGERVAMNAPIQGSAADIIKIAMVNVDRRLAESGLSARLVLQVHDELIVESPESEKDAAAAILKEEMEKAYKLSVPLIVDMNSGKSWYDTK